MRAFKKVVLVCGFVLAFVLSSDAQRKTNTFSMNPEEFLQQIHDMFAEVDPGMAEGFQAEFRAVFPLDHLEEKKRLKVYKKGTKALKSRYRKLKIKKLDFAYADSTSKFSKDQITTIVLTCNQMQKKRLKPIPHFVSYFNALLSFINTNQSDASFEAWNIALNKLLSVNTRYFNTFIKNCNNIFLYRSVYVSPNVRWIRTGDNFTFGYDSLPKVTFAKMDLYCLAKGDTAWIYDTEGDYYLTKGIWYGKGGRVLWTRAGIDPSVSYADLSKYKIEMKSSFYKADSVKYVNSKYFQGEVDGRIEEKLLANTTVKKASYPQFYSYSGRVRINELEKNVDYEGGFMIKGAKLIGKEANDTRAKVIFKRNGKPLLVADARSFTMNDEKISTKSAKIVMYLGEDSIFHPSLKMKFLMKNREISLYRKEQGLSGAPYSNSYHKMDMYIEWLKWKIDQPNVEFTTMVGSSNEEMRLESASYYSAERFNRLQGLQETHPLYIVREFIEEKNNGSREFLDTDLAAHFTLDDNSIQRLLIKFANMGFVMYDIEKGMVTAQQRLFDYLDAKSKKSDYDNITVVSKTKGKPNGVLNLDSYDISLNGVRGVVLSEVRKTGFIPKGRAFTLHKNRDMTYDGILRSGNYEFHGSGFQFSYDTFNIKLPAVDSVRLKAADRRIEKENEQAPYTMVNSVIEGVQGELQIDPPHNKSGIHVDSFPDFPIFTSKGESYVRYNKRNVRGPVYDPQRVYFKLEPFQVDSLGSFTNDGIEFAGTFVSGGIFPDLVEPLRLMPDHSLGFNRETGPSGEPMYGGKATFKNNIILSNKGIMGDGDFEYITSVTKSTDFIFYLDSMNAYAQDFTIDEQMTGSVEYPDVIAKNVNVHYEPEDPDFMKIKNTTFPMTMYNYEARLDGELVYNREKMVGSGLLDFDNAEMTSQLYDFKHTKFLSDTADFKLKAEDIGGVAFAVNNVNAMVDLKERFGEFEANDGASYVDFPVNQYICFMDKFKWFMDNYELELSSKEGAQKNASTGAQDDMDLSGSEFISTHPGQDSLRFVSPKANYDLKNYVIKAHEVKYINVADARIYTSDGEVVVEKDADMQTLKEAEIVANVITKYHTITNATVDITASRNYTAEGDYQYVDADGEEQGIHFNNVRVSSEFETVANGIIGEDQKFMLNPYFEYKGEASIRANKIGMNFKGGTRLVHECDLQKPWLSFAADIDPADVLIPIDDNVKGYDKSNKLHSGIMFNGAKVDLYNIFLAPKGFHSDRNIISAKGFLKYDSDENEYQISTQEKLNEPSFPGNYVALNTETCNIRGDGKLKLEKDFGQVKLITAGEIFSTKSDKQKLNSSIAVDFMLDNGMWKVIEDLLEESTELEPVLISETYFEKGITEIAGKKAGDKLVSELNLFGKFKKIPDEFNHNLIFSDVKMRWNDVTRSFLSYGQIGIGTIGKTQVGKYVDGYIEVIEKKRKSELNIYLEINPDTWFYFNYASGIMKVLSSETAFNATIGQLKVDKRTSKGTKKTGSYTFMQGSKLLKKKFVNRVSTANDQIGAMEEQNGESEDDGFGDDDDDGEEEDSDE